MKPATDFYSIATSVPRTLSLAVAIFLLAACAGPSLKKDRVKEDVSYARAPAIEGVLWGNGE